MYTDFEKYITDASEKTAADYQEAAFQDFLRYLRKEPSATTEAMQKGIDFENMVVGICSGDFPADDKWFEAANKIAAEVMGGQFQVTAQKDITVSGMPLLLYGKIDCLKAGRICDIKFTGKYEAGKFYGSPQHHIYMEIIPEATEFVYLASNGSRVYRETYTRAECKPASSIIEDFLEYLRNSGLLPTYEQHWKARD
jgi:hypothetical protein